MPSRRKALVVGIDQYSSSPLNCCVNDATDMHAALQRMGFASTLVRNCDIRAFSDVIRVFVSSLDPEDIGFFYFAGHGTEASVLQGRKHTSSNWLIACEMPEHRDDLPQFAIDAHNLLARMELRKTRFNALVLDCCRDDPLPSGDRALGGGLASMDPEGSLVAFGCARGQRSAERPGSRNGIFTHHLLAHIETPGLNISDLFIRVGKAVKEATRGFQNPYVNSGLTCEDEERARREAFERSRREAAQERQRQKRQREAAAQAPGMPMQMPPQHDPQMPQCAQGGRVQVVGLYGEHVFANGQNGKVVSWSNGRGKVRIDTGHESRGMVVDVHDGNVKPPNEYEDMRQGMMQDLLGRASGGYMGY